MTRDRRPAIAGLSAAAVIAALLIAPAAHADTPGPYLATQGNGSDPHIIKCADSATRTNGYCLYTSVDMGQNFAYDGNAYPMEQTKVYYSENGYSNWVDKGTVFHENTIEQLNGQWVPNEAHHLWAPGAVYNTATSKYYLYVPDVFDTSADAPPNSSTSSQIAVSSSSSPFGPFTYLGRVSDYGYMSDPDVVVDGNSRYIIWAYGDNSTCGGIDGAALQTDMRTIGDRSRKRLDPSGIGVLGNCNSTGHPYLEGATISKVTTPTGKTYWRMLLAAKPDHVPTECGPDFNGLNTDYEVIAWATAANALGPYTYRGIVMCGSTSEWTNQATIATAANGRKVIYYHDADGADTPDFRQRNLHAECLFTSREEINEPFNNLTIVGGVYRQPLDAANGFNDCMNGTNASYWGWHATDRQVPGMAPIIRAPADGSALGANRYAVGPWERYRRVLMSGSNVYAYVALSNGLYLCTPDPDTPVSASCSSPFATGAQWEERGHDTTGDFFSVNLFNTSHQKFLSVAGNSQLYASAIDTNTAARVTYLYPGGKST